MNPGRSALAKRTTILAALASAAVALPACVSTPASRHEAAPVPAPQAPPASEAASAERDVTGTPDAAAGRALYRQYCSHCHGFNLVNAGVSAPDLRRFPSSDKTRFVETVNNGRNAMPPWRQKLSAADVEALWAYISAAAVQAAGS